MNINQDYVPSTIKDAVNHIVESLSIEDRQFIEAYNNNASVHHTIGRYIRNNWSLWGKDSPLKRDAVNTYGIAHADDISSLVLDWVYHIVNKEEFNPHQAVKKFHEHWGSFGMTSLEAGGWPSA